MTRAAIWGASGFIGSTLCAAAEAKGWTVKRLPRRSADSATLSSTDVAYHCAGNVAETDPAEYANAADRFARACSVAEVKHLVYLSTVAVYGINYSGEIHSNSPMLGTSTYAASRIRAERAMQASLMHSATRLSVIRVPTILGRGMSGVVIQRFARAVGWGLFVHPGPARASLACLGVRRLAEILLKIGELPAPPAVAQFSDEMRWIDIAKRVGELRGRRILRVPLPALGGKLALLASTVRYHDDSIELFGQAADIPKTAEDLDAALSP